MGMGLQVFKLCLSRRDIEVKQRYNILPVPKPRQTRADKWKKRPCVMRYRAFADQVKLMGITIYPGDSIEFILPMPKSWSKIKKAVANTTPHLQVPDIDNLLKSLLDACYDDDSHIWMLNKISKKWGYEGEICITHEENCDD